MDEPTSAELLRAMQVDLDEEIKDVSRKLDALTELVAEMLPALQLAPARKEQVRAAMDKLVAAQEIATENARRRAERYASTVTSADAGEEDGSSRKRQ